MTDREVRSDAAAPSLLGIDAKRWAQRADELQFTQLADIRATAGNWRTGLAGLTSLLSVTSIVVAPSVADKLSAGWFIGAGAAVLLGLLALLYGTWAAMSAAFGVPDDPNVMTGERLRAWETSQTRSGASKLRCARLSTLAGLLMLIAGTGIVAVGTMMEKDSAALVRIDTPTGDYCGHLASGDRGTVTVVGADGTVHTISIVGIEGLQAVSSC